MQVEKSRLQRENGFLSLNKRELARAAGHSEVEFVVTDVYDIPSYHADTFDLVLVTVGVLSWMPDLPGFFEVASSLVRRGGHLLIEDIHPVLMMFEEGSEVQIDVIADEPDFSHLRLSALGAVGVAAVYCS